MQHHTSKFGENPSIIAKVTLARFNLIRIFLRDNFMISLYWRFVIVRLGPPLTIRRHCQPLDSISKVGESTFRALLPSISVLLGTRIRYAKSANSSHSSFILDSWGIFLCRVFEFHYFQRLVLRLSQKCGAYLIFQVAQSHLGLTLIEKHTIQYLSLKLYCKLNFDQQKALHISLSRLHNFGCRRKFLLLAGTNILQIFCDEKNCMQFSLLLPPALDLKFKVQVSERKNQRDLDRLSRTRYCICFSTIQLNCRLGNSLKSDS